MNNTGRTPTTAGDLPDLLNRASRLFIELDRPDLAGTMQTARDRIRRPDTVVAVVGEFKQGKSSLVNALLGTALSPVADDVATAAVAWFRYRNDPQLRVHLRQDGERSTEEINSNLIRDFLTESGNPGNVRGVELVEFGVPNPVLERGLTFLDTPGTDGIDEAVGRAVLDYLSSAHGLIFVTDASAELNAVELRFLAKAADRCPIVVVALSKIDLYPEWKRIRDLDAGHLASIGDIPIVPVSSVLRVEALARSNAGLNDESGIPELLAILRSEVIDGSSEHSAARGRADLKQGIQMVMGGLQTQRNALADTASAQASMTELLAARERLEQVRKAGSRWSTLLSDGITDLNQSVDERLRLGFRALLEEADEKLGSNDPAAVWDEYVREVRQAVAETAADVTGRVTERTQEIATEVARQLGDEEGPMFNLAFDSDRGPAADETGLELPESKFNPFSAVFTGLRGGSSGIILLGMIGRLAGLALATPVSVGVGVAFGTKQVMDERRRLVEKRRQEARGAARRYLSQAQADLSAAVREQVRGSQRTLRDGVSERLNELNETLTVTIRSIESGLRQADEQRQALLPQLDERIGLLEELLRSGSTAPA